MPSLEDLRRARALLEWAVTGRAPGAPFRVSGTMDDFTRARALLLGEDEAPSCGCAVKRCAWGATPSVGESDVSGEDVGPGDTCGPRGPAALEVDEDNPQSGLPPLVWNAPKSLEKKRQNRPTVGHAQRLLNRFLAPVRSPGGEKSCRGDVEELRNTLANVPPQLKVDCWFGSLTERATKAFQICRGLVVDGKVGSETWRELLELQGVPEPSPARPVPLTVEDVRNERIDVPAQESLLRLSKDPATSADARGMVDAVRSEPRLLDGIFNDDEQVPSLRARRWGKSGATVVQEGEDAAVLLDPDAPIDGRPLIVFRKSVRSDKPRIDAALVKAWRAFLALRATDTPLQVCDPSTTLIAGVGALDVLRGPFANIFVPKFCAQAAQPGAAPAPAGPKVLTIELVIRFSLATRPGVARFTGEVVPGATITVVSSGVSVKTDKYGKANLRTSDLVGRRRVLRIEPAPSELSPGLAGPGHGTGNFSTEPPFLFRPFLVEVDVTPAGFISKPAPTVRTVAVRGAPPHALLFAVSPTTLTLDWKPDWMRAANRNAIRKKPNDFLVIHQTGGQVLTPQHPIEDIGPALNTFLRPSKIKKKQGSKTVTVIERNGIHYIVDVDGHVVKLVHESDGVNQVGRSFFLGHTGLNARAIGIENVHSDRPTPRPFAPAQYTSLLRLVAEILHQFPKITRQRVVGHGEVAVVSNADLTISTRRRADPGPMFEWERLEAARLARTRTFGAPPNSIYGIRQGQRLSLGARGPNIAQIKQDLSVIGYSIAKNGTAINPKFDLPLERAVIAFQLRHFSGSRIQQRPPGFVLGVADFDTAHAIKSVLADQFP